MQKNLLITIGLCLVATFSLITCKSHKQTTSDNRTEPKPLVHNGDGSTLSIDGEWQPIVAIITNMGEIRVKLYNETPLHRDNFLQLVKEKKYDSLLFHRVIQKFVVQGGDPDSKTAKPGKKLGDGEMGEWIKAEFNTKLFHKRGALAAAREADILNPEQKSSGCQFYIVQGKIFTDSLLKIQGKRITKSKTYNKVINDPAYKNWVEKYKLHINKNADSANFYNAKIDKAVEQLLPSQTLYNFSAEQIKAYTTDGGTPHLDGSYTVFGEVIQGMDIVDKIAAAPRDENDRPITDMRITYMVELKRI
jgi:peptidylprolyl isomerase